DAELVWQIGRAPPPRRRADEVPEQKPPGRVARPQHARAAIPRPLVDVVHPPVGRLNPARLKPPQPPESPVRRHSRLNSRGRAEQPKDAQELGSKGIVPQRTTTHNCITSSI